MPLVGVSGGTRFHGERHPAPANGWEPVYPASHSYLTYLTSRWTGFNIFTPFLYVIYRCC